MHDGICIGKRYTVPEEKYAEFCKNCEEILCLDGNVIAEPGEPDEMTKLFMTCDSGIGKNCISRIISKKLLGLHPRVLEFLRSHRCAISGSFATFVAMKLLGLDPGFVPNDVDIFCEVTLGRPADCLEMFNVTKRIRARDYCEIDNCCMLAIYEFTLGQKFQAILMCMCEKSLENFEYGKRISKSIDFSVAAPVIYWHECNYHIYIPNISDIIHRRLVQQRGTLSKPNSGPLTKPERVEKWSARGFARVSEYRYVRPGMVAIGDGIQIPRPEITHVSELHDQIFEVTGATEFCWCKNLKIRQHGSSCIIICACENVEIETLEDTCRIHVENSFITLTGQGGEVFAFSGEIIVENAEKFFSIETSTSDIEENWYLSKYDGSVTRVIDAQTC